MSYFQKHKRIAQEVEAHSHSRNAHSRILTQEPPKTRKPTTTRIAEDDVKTAKTREKDAKPHPVDSNRTTYLSAQDPSLVRRELPPPP